PGGVVGHPQQLLAFFPVLPLLARALHAVTGLSVPYAGLLVSMACGLAGTVALWRLVQRRYDRDVASDSVLLLLVAPFAFVFSLFYTEGPALLATALCFLALDRRRWGWAGIAALAGGLIRPNGFLLVVPCVVAAVLAIRAHRDWRALAAPLLAPLGFLAWVAFAWHRTGQLGGYFTLQRSGWGAAVDFGRGSIHSIADLVTFHWTDMDRVLNAAALLVIGGVGLLLAVRRRLDPVWIAYAAAVVVLTFVNQRQASAGRFLLLAFPLFVAFALSLPKRVFPLVVAMSAVAMGGLFYAALLGDVTP
ncbi:MAG TPA: glycosyltransferase family 39 protein, partial [Acidimicrobiales bacterium]